MDYAGLENNMPSTNNEETVNITAFIPTLTNENLKYIYRLSKTVRLLSVLDFLFGLFMFFFGKVGLYVVIRLLCSLSGYYGAKNYDYCLSLMYLGFLVLGTVAELLFIGVYKELFNEGEINKNTFIIGVLYQILFFTLKAYITRFVCIFSSKIRDISSNQKTELINYDSQPVEIVYW